MKIRKGGRQTVNTVANSKRSFPNGGYEWNIYTINLLDLA